VISNDFVGFVVVSILRQCEVLKSQRPGSKGKTFDVFFVLLVALHNGNHIHSLFPFPKKIYERKTKSLNGEPYATCLRFPHPSKKEDVVE